MIAGGKIKQPRLGSLDNGLVPLEADVRSPSGMLSATLQTILETNKKYFISFVQARNVVNHPL